MLSGYTKIIKFYMYVIFSLRPLVNEIDHTLYVTIWERDLFDNKQQLLKMPYIYLENF